MTQNHDPAAQITVEMHIAGQVASEAFADWICHRARLLDLTGWVKIVDEVEIVALVTGNAVLVDAMEVACSLGPADVFIDQIECRILENTHGHNGFTHVTLAEGGPEPEDDAPMDSPCMDLGQKSR